MTKTALSGYGVTPERPHPLQLWCVAAFLPADVKQARFPTAKAKGFYLSTPAFTQWLRHKNRVGAKLLIAPDVVLECPQAADSEKQKPSLWQPEPALQDRNYGAWCGQKLSDLPAEDLAQFLQQPDFSPSMGESLNVFQARVSDWVSGWNDCGVLLARPAVIKAIAAHVLQADSQISHRLDLDEGTVSLFTRHAGLWRVRQLGAPLTDER
ncbi:histidine phosphatase family protein [Acetobacter indonesiensis]|uniref:histidine phosphatase family protein n=1 Tax=Acetobacter indonesiensis TaxID=104101 RepID=UPI0015C4F494|nr:histidine phosphatase family protein [Acetobacter indonesiensis]